MSINLTQWEKTLNTLPQMVRCRIDHDSLEFGEGPTFQNILTGDYYYLNAESEDVDGDAQEALDIYYKYNLDECTTTIAEDEDVEKIYKLLKQQALDHGLHVSNKNSGGINLGKE